MILILHPPDHADRAKALAASLAGASAQDIRTTVPRNNKVHTLIFWGHGDAWKMAGLKPNEMIDLIKAWKKKNSKLKTVEFITCNAHHSTGQMSPFAVAVKRGLGVGFRSSTRNITVKALPANPGGSHNAFSILLADCSTKSWCYVTGPGANDAIMQEGAKLIQYHDVGGRSVSFKGNIAERANQVLSSPDHERRQWTMNYGSFKTLRASLVAV